MAAPPTAQAATVILRNDSALIEAATEMSTDVLNWTVAGVDHASQRWYWYRVGAQGSQDALDTLELESQVLTDTDFDGLGDTLFLGYRDAGGTFRMSVRYQLSEGVPGSGVSVLDELVTVENTLDQPLVFHFIGFRDQPMADVVLDTSVRVENGPLVVHTGGALALHLTAITPSSNAVETSTQTTVLHRLADAASPSFGEIVRPPEPYDSGWAFQWTIIMAPRGAFQISKVTRLVSDAGYCGDGVVGIDEQCDDGNLEGGDGCSDNCTLERECRVFCSAQPVGHGGESGADSEPFDDTDSDWDYDSDSDSDDESESADDSDEGTYGHSPHNQGNQPLQIGFDAAGDCGEVSAVIDTACGTIPVENGQLVNVLCVTPDHDDGCFFEFRGANGDHGHSLLDIRSASALLTVIATNDAGVTTSCTKDLCVAAGGTDDWEGEIDCGCSVRLATLTLQYNGDRPAFIEVEQKKGNVIVFSGLVSPDERFGFVGTVNGTLGSKIEIFADDQSPVVIPVKCSKSIGIGSIFGDFEVVEGADRNGRILCRVD